jgi:hypothetical protein
MTARDKTFGFATIGADELCANQRLRECFVACNFRKDLAAKRVAFRSPGRRHAVGAVR